MQFNRLICVCVCVRVHVCVCPVTQSCLTLCESMDCYSIRLLCPWDFPGKNTGVSCHFPLQGIFPTQGLNPCLLCLLHWQADSLLLSHLGRHVRCVLWTIIRTIPRKLRLREYTEFLIVTHMKIYKGLKLIVTLS